jgi:dihydrodipicolinate synthase/N-acetylneuraminate lyase
VLRRYNFPQHTGNLITPELFRRLARDFPLIRGIKNVRAASPFAGVSLLLAAYV